MARRHFERAHCRLEPHPSDPFTVPHQPDGPHTGAWLDATVETCLEQSADKRQPGTALVADASPFELLGGNAVGRATTERRFRHRQRTRQMTPDGDPVTPDAQLVEGEHG